MTSTPHTSSYDLNRQRQHLETLVQQPTQPSITLGNTLKQFGAKTMKFFTGHTEPRIWQRTRSGHSVWFAHDPITNRTRSFVSEQDVRIWLDNRYYD
ncbi:hypothetical protein IQ254_13990 [Nodosilinea sp. LEGE 07088]|uniref:hypothetical protein n=1 Tax=Nodosilinea sp. LEGE 07088 TaxID=2777968 RepID=UPI00187E5E49|nr:hypothetical protein [Nodosilinea sp. LEGE 07088]MBE9138283.1 hypothetical protein [Nodosilinea sp. LEGE 07088]